MRTLEIPNLGAIVPAILVIALAFSCAQPLLAAAGAPSKVGPKKAKKGGEAVAPVETAEPEEAPAKPTPRQQRSKALAKPIEFHSKGHWKAVMVKVGRELVITLAPIRKDGELTGVSARIVERTADNKVTTGVLEVTPNGAFRARKPELISAANVAGIDPVLREKLLTKKGPFKAKGQIEVKGDVQIVDISHKRLGDVAEDGSMQVESTSTSADGKVKMVTVVTLAPDGLPWIAETKGSIVKGPVTLQVSIKLTRQGVEQPAEE